MARCAHLHPSSVGLLNVTLHRWQHDCCILVLQMLPAVTADATAEEAAPQPANTPGALSWLIDSSDSETEQGPSPHVQPAASPFGGRSPFFGTGAVASASPFGMLLDPPALQTASNQHRLQTKPLALLSQECSLVPLAAAALQAIATSSCSKGSPAQVQQISEAANPTGHNVSPTSASLPETVASPAMPERITPFKQPDSPIMSKGTAFSAISYIQLGLNSPGGAANGLLAAFAAAAGQSEPGTSPGERDMQTVPAQASTQAQQLGGNHEAVDAGLHDCKQADESMKKLDAKLQDDSGVLDERAPGSPLTAGNAVSGLQAGTPLFDMSPVHSASQLGASMAGAGGSTLSPGGNDSAGCQLLALRLEASSPAGPAKLVAFPAEGIAPLLGAVPSGPAPGSGKARNLTILVPAADVLHTVLSSHLSTQFASTVFSAQSFSLASPNCRDMTGQEHVQLPFAPRIQPPSSPGFGGILSPGARPGPIYPSWQGMSPCMSPMTMAGAGGRPSPWGLHAPAPATLAAALPPPSPYLQQLMACSNRLFSMDATSKDYQAR